MQRESRKEILAFVAVGFCAFLWVCLLTYDPRDFLGPLGAIRNACGPVGAFVSFQTVQWLGVPAAYGLAALLSFLSLAILFRRSVPQLGWKILGAVLFLLALSSFDVAVHKAGELPRTLPGGYYGQFFYGWLLGNLSTFGTYLLLGVVALVAFVISTDTMVYPLLARTGGVALRRERWEQVAGAVRKTSRALHLPRVPVPRPRITWEWKRGATRAPEETPRKARKRPARETETPSRDAADTTETAARKETAAALEETGTAAVAEPAAPQKASGGQKDAPPAGKRPPLKIREAVPPLAAKKRPVRHAEGSPYKLPPLDMLEKPTVVSDSLGRAILEQTAAKIEETLMHFKIEARVVEVQKGPTITQFELSLAAGIKVHRIMNLSDDLAMALKAPSIRIIAPIPGKSTVGIEVPNKTRNTVCLREVLSSSEIRDEDYQIPLALGKDVAGAPVLGDLGDMPHLLIAGSTGSGKSICINSIITTILLTRTPDEVKLILVDPKMVELAQFEKIPHLLAPVVTDMKKAPAMLGWTVDKMEERYEMFAAVGVRHITSYNSLGKEKLRERLQDKLNDADIDDFPERLPWIIVVIDELADLMMTASKEVEASITRLSQKSRAVGIHVILATQRPSVDVITGLIKANMPSRISFHVASKVDSRTILDRNGAEKLLGKGDMLYLPPGTSALRRVQGTYISDKEIRDIVEYSVHQAEPDFSPELTRFGVDGAGAGNGEDDLYDDAVRVVLGSRRGSVTLLQRQLQIGYTRASRLMELMHEQGLVGPFKGSKAREVYYTLEEWEQAQQRRANPSQSEEQEDEDSDEYEEEEEAGEEDESEEEAVEDPDEETSEWEEEDERYEEE